MQIGKVAQQTGLTIDAIRFYQKIGLIKEASRSEGGYRLFTDAEIQDLNFIREAQHLGFSLDDIRRLSVLRKAPDHACVEVRALLQERVHQVRAKMAELENLHNDLKRALRECDRGLRSAKHSAHADCCPVLERFEGKRVRKRKA